MDQDHKEISPELAGPGDAPQTLSAVPTLEAAQQAKQAREWRKRAGFSREQLSRITGYSVSHITNMEREVWGDHEGPRPQSWQRYKLACAAALLGLEFDWQDLAITTPSKAFKFELRPLPGVLKGVGRLSRLPASVKSDQSADPLRREAEDEARPDHPVEASVAADHAAEEASASEPAPQSGPAQEPPEPAEG